MPVSRSDYGQAFLTSRNPTNQFKPKISSFWENWQQESTKKIFLATVLSSLLAVAKIGLFENLGCLSSELVIHLHRLFNSLFRNKTVMHLSDIVSYKVQTTSEQDTHVLCNIQLVHSNIITMVTDATILMHHEWLCILMLNQSVSMTQKNFYIMLSKWYALLDWIELE